MSWKECRELVATCSICLAFLLLSAVTLPSALEVGTRWRSALSRVIDSTAKYPEPVPLTEREFEELQDQLRKERNK